MSDTSDLGGLYGDLILTGWIGEAPDTGRDAAFLLLITRNERAPLTMPQVADDLGLSSTPLTVTPKLTADTHVTLNGGWVRLHIPGGEHFEHPASAEWQQTARQDGRVVLVIGYRPLRQSEEADAYAERAFHERAAVVGIVPLH